MIGIVCAFFHTEGKGFYSKGYEKFYKKVHFTYITIIETLKNIHQKMLLY